MSLATFRETNMATANQTCCVAARPSS